MNQTEKEIHSQFGSICFDTPDNTSFKEAQRVFEPFFKNLNITTQNDTLKLIMSLKHGML